jgi:hypothetical protein
MASQAVQTRSTDALVSSTLHPIRRACPDCGSHRTCRSQRFGVLERYVLSALQIRPFRCIVCYRRFYRRDRSAQR